jgi:hypothetical protein
MEAIKHSKIIIVLLILYIAISIIVVTLDKSQKKSKSSSSGTKEVDKKAIEDFLDEIENINSKVILYVNEYNIVEDKCIPLSNIFEDESYTGSVYVSSNNTSMRLWYSNGKYAVNNIEIEEQDVTENDIEDGYTTEYHDSCGLTL